MIVHGDCLDVMAGMDPETFDAIVTDPPYGLEFMGKEWDKLDGGFARGGSARFANSPPLPSYGTKGPAMQEFHRGWAEAAYRVAKPSAYLLAFGGTRTVHRMTVALEDAGWIIRDMLVWAYASGFPKSKASLKPAWEPIVMARKPGPLRMLAIDECRIPMSAEDADTIANAGGFMQAGWQGPDTGIYNKSGDVTVGATVQSGRWPANVILTDPIFDGGVEGVVGGGETTSGSRTGQYAGFAAWSGDYGPVSRDLDGDSGTYSRFFLIPKADRTDREPVLGGQLETKARVANGPETQKECPVCGSRFIGSDGYPTCGHGERIYVPQVNRPRANVHPTVKPTDLMRHLVRLVTPTGGIVLDPFLGSGTTGLAAEMEGFAWVGIEREAEYVAIAEARLNGTQRGLGLETA